MIRRVCAPLLLAAAALAAAGPHAHAQGPTSYSPYAYNPYLRAPGNYGMAYGVPSYGVPRTYSAFSSPYGGGYGYGFAPSSYLPGSHGAGLWRPSAAPVYPFAPSSYRTFAVPYRRGTPSPAVGYYAPTYGPPAFMMGGG